MNKEIKELVVRFRRQGGKEESVSLKDSLTLGKEYGSDIKSSAPYLPSSYVFMRRIGKGETLCLMEGMEGEVRKGGESVKLQPLMKLGVLKKKGEIYLLDVTPGMCVELRVGDAELTIEHIGIPAPKAESVGRPLMPRDWFFWAIIAASVLLHASFAYYLDTLPLKKEKTLDEMINAMPQRFARLILSPKQRAIEKKALEKPKEEAAKEEVEEKKPIKEEKTAQKQERKPEAAKKVQGRGLLGVIGAKGGVLSSIKNERLWRDVDSLILTAKSADSKGDPLAGMASGERPSIDVSGEWKIAKKTEHETTKERKNLAERDGKTILTKRQRQEAEVYKTVRSYSGGLKYLYNAELRKNSSLKGAITVKITISTDGRVEKAVIEKSTMNHREFEAAVMERISLWKFKPMDDGENFTINYTFDFSPVG
ncbi:MAG: AgmX/PglI C-terminal domain-containing protein [Thermodesulfobacteriota bacterium]